MATATPLGPPGPRRRRAARRVARAGRPAIRRQHPSSRVAARKVSAPVRRAHIPDTRAAPGPGPGTWKDPDPRRQSSRGSGGSEQACLPGNDGYATPAGCPVSTTSWRYGLRRTCRLVTGRSHRPRSTWPDRARLALLAVTHRCKRTHCLWLEQFQIDALMFVKGVGWRFGGRGSGVVGWCSDRVIAGLRTRQGWASGDGTQALIRSRQQVRDEAGDGRRIVSRPAGSRQPNIGSGRPRGLGVSRRPGGGGGRPPGRRNASGSG